MFSWIVQLVIASSGLSTGVQSAVQYAQQLPPLIDQSAITCHDAAWETQTLTTIDGMRVHTELKPFLEKMKTDAAKSGHYFIFNSTYRTCSEQASLRAYACGTGDYNMNLKPIKDCQPPTEPAGRSLHNEGLAVDVACSGYTLFESSPCYNWLKQHHIRYALFEHELEPWHWSTTGK